MKNRKRLIAYAVLTAVLVVIPIPAGCGDEGTTPPEETPTPYDATEPRYVLANVKLAIDAGDLGLLGNCLADDFAFRFDVNDIGQEVNGYVIPASWTRAEFLASAGNMFTETYDLSLVNHWEGIGSPGQGETYYQAVDVPLAIMVMVEEGNGYVFDDGVCDYEFEKETTPKWFLTTWRDRSRECGCLGPSTFGRILAGYYP